MRNVSLADLIRLLKAEVGAALDDGTASDQLFAAALENKQHWFAAHMQWPFLRKQWDVSANARYVAFPTTDIRGEEAILDTTMPFYAKVKWGQFWEDIGYGISGDEYNAYDPDDNETSDPVQRYQFTEYEDTLQIEVWPTPSTAQTVRVWGQRELKALADGCDIDHLLLVYSTAAELLARFDQKDAQLKAQLANNRLLQLQSRAPQPQKKIVFGRDYMDEVPRRVVKIVTTG